MDKLNAIDKTEEQRKNYSKTRDEDIFTAENVQDFNGDKSTKYKADEQIGQCAVEEVQYEGAEKKQPAIEEVDPTESSPPEKAYRAS